MRAAYPLRLPAFLSFLPAWERGDDLKDSDHLGPCPGLEEATHEDRLREDEPFSFEELDFELEMALGRATVLQASDRLLRAEPELTEAPALLLRRNRLTH